MHAHQLLAGLVPDPGGSGGEVDAGEELIVAGAGVRGDVIVEAQKLS